MQLQPHVLFHNRYHLVEEIGAGGYSQVWLAHDTLAGNLEVALKIFSPGHNLGSQGLAIFSKEYAIVFNLNHSNLLRPMHFDHFDGSPYLVLPYCQRGSVFGMIGETDEPTLARFILQAASALEYLHSQDPPIIHQDIKPDNFLIDNQGNYLLTDFGISSKIRRTLTKSMGQNASAGTLAYMPPEKFTAEKQTIKAGDIFALGATLYELLTGELPFGDHGGMVMLTGAQIPNLPGHFSPELNQIIRSCLAREPWDRPTAEQLHQYAQSFLEKGKWSVQSKSAPTQQAPEPKPTSSRPTQHKVETPEVYHPAPKFPTKKNTKNQKLIWVVVAMIVIGVGVTAIIIGNARARERQLEIARVEQESLAEEKAQREQAQKDSLQTLLAKQEQERLETERRAEEQRRQQEEAERLRREESARFANFTETTSGINLEMIAVKGGTFTMGCTSEQGSDCGSDEKPAHPVTVSDFYIGKYEVTQRQWHAVMGSNPSHFSGCENCPVEQVSWNEVQEFIRKLNRMIGKNYRLPTEAEWEYAARGGSQSRGYKNAGSSDPYDVAWFTDDDWFTADDGNRTKRKTSPVGQKRPNELGIYDMSGNVLEWCSDRYGSYTSEAKTNPTGPSSGTNHVTRGGSWADGGGNLGVSERFNDEFFTRMNDVGFRLALVP